ncbi:MAG: extracellular solute-binding protein [Eubacteriales bacterium]|nr:extracellular solute-binding protein [Eubacteriales bacterium]
MHGEDRDLRSGRRRRMTRLLALLISLGLGAASGHQAAYWADEVSDQSSTTSSEAEPDSLDEPIAVAEHEDFSDELLSAQVEYEHAIPYAEYLELHRDLEAASESVEIYSEDAGMEIEAGAYFTIEFELDQPGCYQMELSYRLNPDSYGQTQFELDLDGERPYRELSPISLRRLYRDANRDYLSVEGNQSFPSQAMQTGRQRSRLEADQGLSSDPLQLALEAGPHELQIHGIQDQFILYEFRLVPVQHYPSYGEYSATATASLDVFEGLSRESTGQPDPESGVFYDYDRHLLIIEAELADLKNNPSLLPINDRSSSLTTPYHPSFSRMNAIGGEAWKEQGSWIEWLVDVPKAGYYRIGSRFLQNGFPGMPVRRELSINGEIPFEEARHLAFPFAQSFQSRFFGDESAGDYLFYLEAGENRLRLRYQLADLAPISEKVARVGQEMNRIYQKIMVITGVSPDPYRDYELLTRIPSLLDELGSCHQLMAEVCDQFRSMAGGDSELSSPLTRTERQLQLFLDRPHDIAKNIARLKDNVTALGQWNLDVSRQTLTLDKLFIAGEDAEAPRAEMNFAERIQHELNAFVGSFYNHRGDEQLGSDASSEKLEVWVTTGRDQLELIRRMVGVDFVPEHHYQVDIKLVPSDVVLPSTFTGNGPDVVIQAGTTLPINLAFRSAAYDLRQFPDYDEVSQSFHQAALDCFSYNGGQYALPDQMSFPVMFYRKDILARLRIPVPETWEDVLSILPFLQANHMVFYLDTATPLSLGSAVSVGNSKAVNAVYLSMLYQRGARLYNEAGTVTEICSPEAELVFRQWTDFYTKHSFPTALDFLTRFRLGEVPIAVVDFSNYSALSVAAPEIAGDYAVAPIPGTRGSDGRVRHDMPVTTSAAMMVRPQVEKKRNAEAAWDFLKWWCSAETQSQYAREMEALLGRAARYPVANLDAFDSIAWPYDVQAVLKNCLHDLREVPQIPGSYISGRNIDNAFYEVINNPRDAVPEEALEKYAAQIDEEISNKLEEFGLKGSATKGEQP